jgi:predicted RNase H-like HicB family nuclease
MEYVFPAIFHKNTDGSYTITYPDLPGCVSEGKTLGNAMYMAESALKQWIEYLSDKKQEIPAAAAIEKIKPRRGEFANLIRAEVKGSHAVRRTVSIPKWMDEEAASDGLSLSRILQDALAERLAR